MGVERKWEQESHSRTPLLPTATNLCETKRLVAYVSVYLCL